MRARRLATWLAAGAAATAIVAAHVRLRIPDSGKLLFWADQQDVSIVIHSGGSEDLGPGEHFPALRNAIAAWNRIPGSDVRLVEDTRPEEQASDNWASSKRHTFYFDDDGSTGYFPGFTGIVALTPVTYTASGEILDADVLFNGVDFRFTTSGIPGRFDVQDVAVHELGHVLGLDHSGCVGASLYPYVDPTVLLHRSLSIDDVRGMQHAYPDDVFARVRGTVARTWNGRAVKGAWVGARDGAGRLASAALTGDGGRFALHGLTSGTYAIYVTPLDGPVSGANLGDGYAVQTNFQAAELGTAVATTGAITELGTLWVEPRGAVNLGRAADDYPLRVVSGETTALLVRGDGLVAGSVLEASDPEVDLAVQFWLNSAVSFSVTVPAGAAPGHVDLRVTAPTGDVDILCGALEVTPPDPLVSSVQPATGDSDGGTALVVQGAGFRRGARVVIGDQVYTDGVPGGCQVVDPGQITLVTRDMLPGLHDVVVIDGTGVEGRAQDAFSATAVPTVDTVFPATGASAGGTTVVLSGEDFVDGALVSIDGVLQQDVTVEGLDRLVVVTLPGVPGGPYLLTVANPNGATATAAFSYSAKPDPAITSVAPKRGPTSGGERITVRGANFTAATTVVFGADPDTGLGGVPATSVELIEAGTLKVVTPESHSKRRTVMVREADTQQAAVLAGAYTFEEEEPGGGGCAAVVPARPPTWRDVAGGAGWLLVLWAVLAARSLRHRQRLVAA